MILAFSQGLSVGSVILDTKRIDLENVEESISQADLKMLPCAISTIGVLEKNDNELFLVGFADTNKSLLVKLELGMDPLGLTRVDDAQNPIHNYIENRLTAGEFLGTTFSQDVASEKQYQLQCFGMAVSPLGDYIAFLHSIVPDAQLRYPILSNLRYRVSFMFLTDYNERLIPEKVAVPCCPTSYSPMAAWWKIQAVSKSLRSKMRESYLESICKQLYQNSKIDATPVDTKVDLSLPLEQQINTKLFDSSTLDSYRLYCHYKEPSDSYPRLILDKLCLTVLLFLLKQEDTVVLETVQDRAIVLSYCQTLLTSPNKQDQTYSTTANACLKKFGFSGDDAGMLAIAGDGFEETFNFLQATDVYAISSEKGHVWRRCSTTLIPLTYYNGRTCSGCARPVLEVQEDQGYLVSTIFKAVDICIYCGCRFMKN